MINEIHRALAELPSPLKSKDSFMPAVSPRQLEAASSSQTPDPTTLSATASPEAANANQQPEYAEADPAPAAKATKPAEARESAPEATDGDRALDSVPTAPATVPEISGDEGGNLTSAETADEIWEKIRERVRRADCEGIHAILEVGTLLLKAKKAAKHGDFMKTVREIFPGEHRRATERMNAARHFAGKVALVANLNVTALNLLSAKKTPETYRVNYLARRERGDDITSQMVFDEIQNLPRDAATQAQRQTSSKKTIATADAQKLAQLIYRAVEAGFETSAAVRQLLASVAPAIAAEFDALSRLAAETGTPADRAAQ